MRKNRHSYETTTRYHIPFCSPNIFILYHTATSGARVLFMILLQIKINQLQNLSSVYSNRKAIDVIPQIFGSTLSLPMSTSSRLVLFFILLLKSPITLVNHNPSLRRSYPSHSTMCVSIPTILTPTVCTYQQAAPTAPQNSFGLSSISTSLSIPKTTDEVMSDPGWRQAYGR